MQGWRVTMEDSHTHILSLPDDQDAAFFAVYDGHGGANVAQHAGTNLHKFIVQRQEYKSGDINTAFREGFLEFDSMMMKDEQMRDEVAGTTAVTVLIKHDQLYCGNVGDSRAVACIKGKEHPLSSDHKPNNPMESMRIKDAGGWVEYNRVNGNLALSRALGDFVFKRNASKTAEEQMVIALPDVEQRTINEDWEFVVLACDGVWDVLTNSEAVNFIRYRLGERMEPEKICEDLMTNCLSPDCQMGGLGCDNMTVILVCFLHGKSWEDYCTKIAGSLEPNIESFASSLNCLSDNGVTNEQEEDPADESESYVVSELVNPGDTTESVAKTNPVENKTCTVPEAEDKSPEDSKPISSLIKEKAEDILNVATTTDESNKAEQSDDENLEG